jgi:hypothetical protein
MYLYTRPIKSSDLNKCRNAVKSAHDKLRNAFDAKKAAVRSPERYATLAKGLTLGDFGKPERCFGPEQMPHRGRVRCCQRGKRRRRISEG